MEKLTPRAIIFDLGSTLIEYESIPWDELGVICAESGRKYLQSEGCNVPGDEEFHDLFAEIRAEYRQVAVEKLIEWDVPTVASKLFDRLEINYDDGLVDRFFDAYYMPVHNEIYAYDDARETLELLKRSYPVMGLISNTVFPERAHLGELERFGLASYLNFTVFSSTFKLRKPHPDIFYHALNLAGCAPREAVYIGDRYEEDVQGPTSIGMHAILKIKPDREYLDDMPDDVRKISTLRELTNHIEI